MKTDEELWENFVQWSQFHHLVVVCRKCGSSYLDAGLPSTQLICRSCSNTTHFDDERFAGLRVVLFDGIDETQKESLLKKFARDFGYILGSKEKLTDKDRREGDLQHDLLNAINMFLSTFSTVSSKLDCDPKARLQFYDAWDTAKTRIDIIVSEYKKSG